MGVVCADIAGMSFQYAFWMTVNGSSNVQQGLALVWSRVRAVSFKAAAAPDALALSGTTHGRTWQVVSGKHPGYCMFGSSNAERPRLAGRQL